MSVSSFEIETKRRRALFKRELSERKRARGDSFTQQYADITDLTGDPLNWPEQICAIRKHRHASKFEDFRRLFISPTLKYRERFKLTLFLLGNGVNPTMILEYYAANGTLRDVSALRSVKALCKSYIEQTISNFTSYDLTSGRYEKMNNS